MKRVAESFEDTKVLRDVLSRARIDVPRDVTLSAKDIVGVQRIQSAFECSDASASSVVLNVRRTTGVLLSALMVDCQTNLLAFWRGDILHYSKIDRHLIYTITKNGLAASQ